MKLPTMGILIGLFLAGPIAAGDPPPAPSRSPEALEILKKVDAATKAVNAVRYHATAKPSGVAEKFVSPAEGNSVLVGWAGNMPQKFHTHLTTKRPGGGEPVELTGGGDGDTYFLIDHVAKKAYADMDPAVLGSSGRMLLGFGMLEFVHDKPFDDELNADKVELLGTETIGGEECHKIGVVYAGGQGESVWYFAKSDNLPRRRIRKFNVPQQGEGQVELTVSNLEIDPKPDPGLFKLKLPEGYKQVDDFAP